MRPSVPHASANAAPAGAGWGHKGGCCACAPVVQNAARDVQRDDDESRSTMQQVLMHRRTLVPKDGARCWVGGGGTSRLSHLQALLCEVPSIPANSSPPPTPPDVAAHRHGHPGAGPPQRRLNAVSARGAIREFGGMQGQAPSCHARRRRQPHAPEQRQRARHRFTLPSLLPVRRRPPPLPPCLSAWAASLP